MVFSQYGYRNFHNENTDKHPIQPYHWDNWVNMVKENESYCRKMNVLKWIELYFWITVGRVRFVDLPSFHRYWQIQINKDTKKLIKDLICKRELCKKDPEQTTYLFNRDMTLPKLDKIIQDKKQKLNENTRNW